MTQYFLRALTQTQETLENSPDCGKPLKASSKKVKRRLNEEQCLSSCTWQPNRMFKKTFKSEDPRTLFPLQLFYFTKLTSPTILSLVPLFNDIPMVPINLDCLKPCFDKYSVTTNPKLLKKVQKHCSQHGFDRQVPTHTEEGNAHAQANFSNDLLFRHQIQHNTGQLAKDTSTDLHSLSTGVSTLTQSEQRQWKLQKERLQNDFTKALNSFQAAQRTAAEKEKETIKTICHNL